MAISEKAKIHKLKKAIVGDPYPNPTNKNEILSRTVDMNATEYALFADFAESCGCTKGILAKLAIITAIAKTGTDSPAQPPEYQPVVHPSGGSNFRVCVIGMRMSVTLRKELKRTCDRTTLKIKMTEYIRRACLSFVQSNTPDSVKDLLM